MLMSNLNVLDVKAFVPAKDFVLSKRFYLAPGCTLKYDSKGLAIFELSGYRFYLQDYYVKGYADNYMLHFTVEDVESWYQHTLKLLEDFPASDDKLPRLMGSVKEEPAPYNAQVCYLVDPTGVLIHIAQFN